ncbi:MAG: AMP-binding protein, partial [Methylococcales bacterium]|nr:AMP-binding protein [Methylococcales bacterium]
MAELSDAEKKARIAALLKKKNQQIHPLSFSQKRLWFIDQFDPNNAVYNIVAAVKLRGDLNAGYLEQSIQQVIERHQVLRSVFQTLDGKAVVNIKSFDPVKLSNASIDSEHLIPWLQKQSNTPFDLTQGPLYRFELIKLADQQSVLFINCHHIIADGWSIHLLQHEIIQSYENLVNGKSIKVSPLKLQYYDYVRWQNKTIDETLIKNELAYWKSKTTHDQTLLLPTDYPRSAQQTFNGHYVSQSLPKKQVKQLNQFLKVEKTTLFNVLISCFQIMLSKWSGQSQFNIGTPTAGRSRQETENLLGYFINSLIIPVDLKQTVSFKAHLDNVQKNLVDSYAHANIPFDYLVDELQPERSLSHSPLFQVMFAMQNQQEYAESMSNIQLEPIEIHNGGAKFDLTVTAVSSNDGLTFSFEYNTDLFNQATIERFIEQMMTFVGNAINHPEQKINRIEFLPEKQIKLLLKDWGTKQSSSKIPSLIESIEKQAKKQAKLPALQTEVTLSYQQLNSQANQLAHYLIQRGVKKECSVVIMLERSADLIISILAILKTGACYVPVDIDNPDARIQLMIEDCQPTLILLKSTSQHHINQTQFDVLEIDRITDTVSKSPKTNPEIEILPSDPAYIIYTSGSTGKPKGVVCLHQSIANLLVDFQLRKKINTGSQASWWTNFSFDVSVYEIFSALTAGACLHIIPETVRGHAHDLFDWTEDHQINSAYFPPFFLADFLLWLNEKPKKCCLQRLLVGVEPISESLLIEIQNQVEGLQIINGYGPTEATICSTLYN